MQTASVPPVVTLINSRCIVVLGMHRSGTSALTGSLREAGLYLGQVLDRGFLHNPKGLQEAPSVLYMHENLLQTNGGSWHEPPATIVWQPLHKAVRDLFIESRAGNPIWGFKDPRSLLVLEGWLDALPSLECVGIFRHPAEVAASLQSRNKFDMEKCYAIWNFYNQRLLGLHRQLKFPIVEFVEDADVMTESLRALIRHLGLPAVASHGFYEGGLKHFVDQNDGLLPAHTRLLLDELRSCTSANEA